MPRNRIIKPDFWADEKIGMLSHIARLLFIGMWNFADDSGVCRANTAYLRNNIFPYDDITFSEIADGLTELVKNEQILSGEFNSEQYIFIKNFKKHQQINRPSKFVYIKEKYEDIFKGYNNSMSVAATPLTNENENVNVNEKEKGNFFNKKFSEAKHVSVEATKKLIEEKQNLKTGSPLDYETKEEAINWIKVLSPGLRKTSQMSLELMRKWEINTEELD